jgi:response regulator of citrate/malate metabolism
MSNKPIKVLLIEDDPYHAEALQAMIERVHEFDFELFHSYKLQDGLQNS